MRAIACARHMAPWCRFWMGDEFRQESFIPQRVSEVIQCTTVNQGQDGGSEFAALPAAQTRLKEVPSILLKPCSVMSVASQVQDSRL